MQLTKSLINIADRLQGNDFDTFHTIEYVINFNLFSIRLLSVNEFYCAENCAKHFLKNIQED